MEYYVGQIFEEMYPSEAAEWCNNNNLMIQEIDPVGDVRRFQIQEIPAYVPTHEEQSENRAAAYQQEVDPITAHIQRLRDKEQTPETVAEIEQLIAERDAKVEEIKQRYPYPTDPITQ